MPSAVPSCFRLLVHEMERAFSRAWAKTGKRMAARMAMMAITTSSSIRVKAGLRFMVGITSCLKEARLLPAAGGRRGGWHHAAGSREGGCCHSAARHARGPGAPGSPHDPDARPARRRHPARRLVELARLLELLLRRLAAAGLHRTGALPLAHQPESQQPDYDDADDAPEDDRVE